MCSLNIQPLRKANDQSLNYVSPNPISQCRSSPLKILLLHNAFSEIFLRGQHYVMRLTAFPLSLTASDRPITGQPPTIGGTSKLPDHTCIKTHLTSRSGISVQPVTHSLLVTMAGEIKRCLRYEKATLKQCEGMREDVVSPAKQRCNRKEIPSCTD